MSNDKQKSAPRRPDFELDFGKMSVWDNRKEGGHFNFSMSGKLKDVTERIQEAKENARDTGEGERRDDKRSETNRSGREDRRDRDSAPRYER